MSLQKGKTGPPQNTSLTPQQVLQIQQSNYQSNSRGIQSQGTRLEEHYNRTVAYSQSVRQPLHPSSLPSSNIAHDMNKPAFAQPGLPGSTQTQQAVHHSSTSVLYPGQQVPGRQQSSSLSGVQAVGHTQQQLQYYHSRTAAPSRQMQNMQSQRQSVPVGISMSSGSQAGYFQGAPQVFIPPAHVQQVYQPHLIHQQHPSSMPGPVEFQVSSEGHSVPLVPQQPSLRFSVENGEMNTAGMQFRYPHSQQYQPQGNPQIVYQTQVSPYQNIYYHPMLNVAPPNRPGGVPGMGNVQQQAPPPKREKKFLSIVDPNTQRDLTEEILANSRSNNLTPPNSGQSSARATPPSNATPPLAASDLSDIPAQFARQVAAAASSTGPIPSYVKEQRQTQQPQPPVVPSASVTPHLTPVLSCVDSTINIGETELRNQSLLGKGTNISMNGDKQGFVDKPLENTTLPDESTPPEVAEVDGGRPSTNKSNTVLSNEEHVSDDSAKADVPSVESHRRHEVPLVESAMFAVNVGSHVLAAASVELPELEASVAVVPQILQPIVPAQPPPPPLPPSRMHPTVGGPEFTYQGPPPSTPPFPTQKAPEVVHRPPIKDGGLQFGSTGALPTSDKPLQPMPPPPPPPAAPQPQLPPSGLNPPGSVFHIVQDQTITAIPTSAPVLHAPPSHPAQPPTRPSQPVPSTPKSAQPLVTAPQPSTETRQNGEATMETTEPSTDIRDFDNSAKDPKKQKGKKKARDTNRRGETKEGGEMDAFLDKEPTVPQGTVPAQAAALTIVPKQDSPAQQEKAEVEESKGTTEEMIDMEEQRKVAEKNEENAKVSKGMEQQPHDLPVINEPEAPAKVHVPSLKYEYKEDQWSPLNPEGKMQYDRSFLLRLQEQPMSQKRPVGLPDLEIIKDICGGKPRYDHRNSGAIMGKSMHIPAADFTPNFLSGQSSRTRISSRSSLQGRREQQQQPQKKIVNIPSFNQDVKLHKSEDAWRPAHKQAVVVDQEVEKTDVSNSSIMELNRKVRAMLNKLTPQNFGTLMNQVSSFEINDQEKLSGVIDLVFEKAIDEPNFSVAYANMCKKLSSLKVTNQGNEVVNFKKLIINKCQREFEKDADDEMMRRKIELAETDDKKKELLGVLGEAERKSKMRSLGNIRFIGELFKLSVLTSNIMHDCLNKLIEGGDEDSIECLCRLLTTIGKDLEKGPPNTANKKSSQSDNRMEQYFKKMREIVEKKQLSSRVRFMLQDVIELRQQNWIPRRDDNNPKTIDQIHREAEKELLEKQVLLQQHISLPVKRQDDRDRDRDRRSNVMVGGGGGGGGKRGGNNESDGWNTVSSGKRTALSVDPGKLKINRPQDVDENNLSFGPKGFLWARGSSGGVKSSSQEGERPLGPPGNRFSALAGGEHSSTMDSRRNTNRHATMSLNRDSSKGRSTQLPPVAQRSGKTSVPSKEREQAIACVKNLSGNEARHRSSASRDNSLTREGEKRENEVRKGPPEYDRDTIDSKTKHLIDEFLHNNDTKEAILSVTEICSANTMPYFVTATINRVLERTPGAREHVGQLFSELVKNEIMTVFQYNQGLEEILDCVEDYLIDFPMFWDYLSELLSPLFQTGALSLNSLKVYSQRFQGKHLSSKLLVGVLTALKNTMTKGKVRELWQSSGLNFSEFISSNTDLQSFLLENKLDFLQGDAPLSTNECLPIGIIHEGLRRQLQAKSNNESLFDWIHENVSEKQQKDPTFIRALVTAIADSAIKNNDTGHFELNDNQFASLCTVIKRYVDNKDSLESETLYALQAIVNRYQHPRGLLIQLFRIMFNEEVISEDGFTQWSKTDAPREIEGHAVAVKSVNHFLDWMANSKDQEDDEEVA